MSPADIAWYVIAFLYSIILATLATGLVRNKFKL